MGPSMRVFVSLGCLAAAGTAAPECRGDGQTISRDVVVVGGGASGAHAAVWLRDNGHSVVVVEKAGQLGGHTAFYNDPATGKAINVGVQTWVEYKNAFEFPERMNVSASGSMQFTPNENRYIDYKTGKPVPSYTAPAEADVYPALQRYLDVLEKYEDMVLPGFFNFPDPENIPEDLLMPFSEFVDKYDLAAAVPRIWDSTAQGLGDTMNVPTLWVIQACGIPMTRALLGMGAAAVSASGRLDTKKGVSLKVSGTNGEVTCIEAKRLLVAVEPTPENMTPFQLDEDERDVLGRFKYPTVYAGILRHPSLQALHAYTHRLPVPEYYNHTAFPAAPQVGRIDYIGETEDLFEFTAVGTEDGSAESMKALIAQSINAMIEAGTLPASNGSVSFSIFADHGHMHAHVSADDLRAGFMQKLNALQGLRNTWYTGAAFSAGYSTVLWEYNKVLLPKMVEGL
ncbi:Beta-cyclopiazonate dehydrogenase [Madurella fahalii]|uniref:Beta-cyclopiazonate dehydrogenase n=1 Tax=Madurella fahalii TaxID=1157608 RepID=A0ABQ0FYC8_9PEZI